MNNVARWAAVSALFFMMMFTSVCALFDRPIFICPAGNATSSNTTSPGNCAVGYVVQNTTTSGVQCISLSTMSTFTYDTFFNQRLNTTSNVSFDRLSTRYINITAKPGTAGLLVTSAEPTYPSSYDTIQANCRGSGGYGLSNCVAVRDMSEALVVGLDTANWNVKNYGILNFYGHSSDTINNYIRYMELNINDNDDTTGDKRRGTIDAGLIEATNTLFYRIMAGGITYEQSGGAIGLDVDAVSGQVKKAKFHIHGGINDTSAMTETVSDVATFTATEETGYSSNYDYGANVNYIAFAYKTAGDATVFYSQTGYSISGISINSAYNSRILLDITIPLDAEGVRIIRSTDGVTWDYYIDVTTSGYYYDDLDYNYLFTYGAGSNPPPTQSPYSYGDTNGNVVGLHVDSADAKFVSSDGTTVVHADVEAKQVLVNNSLILISSSTPATPQAGQIYFDGSTFYGYAGSSWSSLGMDYNPINALNISKLNNVTFTAENISLWAGINAKASTTALQALNTTTLTNDSILQARINVLNSTKLVNGSDHSIKILTVTGTSSHAQNATFNNISVSSMIKLTGLATFQNCDATLNGSISRNASNGKLYYCNTTAKWQPFT